MITQMSDQSYPSILFKVHHNMYAVNSFNVQSIMPLPKSTNIPQSLPEVMGVILFRDIATPLIDLRMMLGFQSMAEELNEFSYMLDMRKQDHIDWVSELERCIETNEEFTLSTDPHQCKFGQWYDNYTSDNNSVMFHLRKIAEPHAKLHQAALDVEMCSKHCDTCDRDECLKSVFHRLNNDYMPKILKLLEETKDIFNEAARQMVIVIGDEHPVGFVVDEILAVEHLADIEKSDGSSNNLNLDYVVGIKQSKHYKGVILMLNEDVLISRVTPVRFDDFDISAFYDSDNEFTPGEDVGLDQ